MRSFAIAIAAAGLLGLAVPASAATAALKHVQIEKQNAASTEFSSRHRRWHRPQRVRVCHTVWTWRGPVRQCHWTYRRW